MIISDRTWTAFTTAIPNGTWVTVATAGLGAVIAVNLLSKVVRRTILIPKMTILDDLPKVGTRRKDGNRKGCAVVCGGSVAGLLAASVCADHFESVLIVDAEASANELAIDLPKDREIRIMPNGLPTRVPWRKRVMQYSAFHLFYFGSVLCPEVCRPNDTHAPQTLPITREAFEILLRRLVVKSKPNVAFLTGTVDGFNKDEGSAHMLSEVTVRTMAGDRVEPAAFVVDATGPAQASYHKWLANAGFGPLPSSLREEYDPHFSYSQSVWTVPEDVLKEMEPVLPYGLYPGSLYANSPDWSTGEVKGLTIVLLERSQRWGVGTSDLPYSIPEIEACIRSLHQNHPAPEWVYKLLDILSENEEACAPWYTGINTSKFSFVKYHQAERGSLPKNWVAVGDAVMNLNPVYGQGCTKALMDAVALDSLLRRVPSGRELPSDFSNSYFKKAAARTGSMWDGNKANDYGWPSTEPVKGETLAKGTFIRNFGRHVVYVCRKDGRLFRMWQRVVFGLAPSTDFFAPSMMARVAWSWLTG
ncbi:hypothetical protein FRB97_009008 [Tulasnella sp. 331]|nr:hypothetical protein FRB97_009008 [Tulasnella sp. 331]